LAFASPRRHNAPVPNPSDQPVLTYDPQPSAPRLRLPARACDTHVHVFGPAPRFPFAAGRNFTPVDAPKEALFALHRTLGIERCVIVQSAVHGTDNRAVEDAIATGQGRYLGVALVAPGVADSELARLAAIGFRGVRFNFMRHLAGASIDDVVALTPRLAAVGLHLQVHFESALVHDLAGPLARSAAPVVIDHMGRVDATLGPDHADFRALVALLRNPLFRVKVSGIDRIDSRPASAPLYALGVELARRLVEAFPDRCFWGTDWPHPNHTHVPDDAALVDALERIAPTPAAREQLLVANPADFYRFAA
jgi:2-pyrone-4,6-dicarboxylate lactonase